MFLLIAAPTAANSKVVQIIAPQKLNLEGQFSPGGNVAIGQMLYKKVKVPLIVEMHYDKNLRHGPFRLWMRVKGQKGELLTEGRQDYELSLGPEGSGAYDRRRCL
ncbi:MAG: hypothetical protein ACR2O7_01350 [Parasphingorhabdus sp.]